MDTKIYGNGYADTQVAAKGKAAAVAAHYKETAVPKDAEAAVEKEETAAVLELSEEAKEAKQPEELTEKEKELQRLQEMLERIKESAKAAEKEKKKVKKRLNYSYRRVSANIMRAKSRSQAGNALSSANSNLNSLRRQSATGNYDEDELAIAIVHAKKMIRIARKKMNHIRAEEQLEKADDSVVSGKKIKQKQIFVQEIKKESDKEIKELEEKLLSLQKQGKRANRQNENMDLVNADLEYLRRKIELIKQGKGDFAVAQAAAHAYANQSLEGTTAAMTETAAAQGELEQKAEAVSSMTQGSTSMAVDVIL